MKILFFINSLHTAGGTERITSIIANKLVTRDSCEVGIVALHGGSPPFFEVDSRVRIQYINPKGVKSVYWNLLSNIYKLRKLYKTEKPNFVIDVCSSMSLLSIPASIKTNIKIITWEHFNSNIDWNVITTPLSRILATIYATKIVTLTQRDADNYQKRYKANNVISIPNPITINPTTKTNLSEKRILAIGRFTHQKGFDLLLEAWYKTKAKDNGWFLRIIGHGEMEHFLYGLVRQYHLLESVEILSPTNDIVKEYQNASIYVMSSRFEGLPLVLIEAMAMGLPIISFDCETGPSEIVLNNTTGFLIEKFNIEEFARKIDLLVTNTLLLSKFSKNAIKRSEKFEISHIIKKWIDLLDLPQ